MLIIFKTIQKNIKHIDDLKKYEHTRHLDPSIHHQMWNSAFFNAIFDRETGNKRDDIDMEVSILSQLSKYEEDIESVKIKELPLGEKLRLDFLLVTNEGSTEMRRNEASNTLYRFGLVRKDELSSSNMKVISITQTSPTNIYGAETYFSSKFIQQITNYLKSAIWQYYYDNNIEKNQKIKGRGLGIFETMLSPKTVTSLKEIVSSKPKGYDFNQLLEELVGDVFDETHPIIKDIIQDINDYFENITFKNDDSFVKDFTRLLSSSAKTKLVKYATLFKNKIKGGEDVVRSTASVSSTMSFETLLEDPAFKAQMREYIANDFVLAMEDSIFFFGDFSYYKDPTKRRKIISNNGATIIAGNMMKSALQFIEDNDSLTAIYHNNKNLPNLPRNQAVVRKLHYMIPLLTLNGLMIKRERNQN